MRRARLILMVLGIAATSSGCRLLSASDDVVLVSGTVRCDNGQPVTQGQVGLYQGEAPPLAFCLQGCRWTNPAVLAEQRLTDGRFELALALNDDAVPENLWILAAADGELCGAGYNFEQRALVLAPDDRHMVLEIVIAPFFT